MSKAVLCCPLIINMPYFSGVEGHRRKCGWSLRSVSRSSPECRPCRHLAISHIKKFKKLDPVPDSWFSNLFAVFFFFQIQPSMATLRVSALSLSRRSLSVCLPRLQLGVRCRTSVRPSFRPSIVSCAKQYSTATLETERLAPKVERGASKLFKDADEAVADLKSGSTILSSGFGLCGVAG